jgi:hypothetical protein
MARGKRTSGQKRQELVAEYRASGLTRKTFCQAMGISVCTLDYHVRRENQQERKQAKLLPVEFAPSSSPSPLTLVFGSGVRLEVGAGFDDATLRRLLAALS